MPFKSQAQRRFMYAKHPELAKEFEDATGDKKLPEHVKARKRKKRRGLGGSEMDAPGES